MSDNKDFLARIGTTTLERPAAPQPSAPLFVPFEPPDAQEVIRRAGIRPERRRRTSFRQLEAQKARADSLRSNPTMQVFFHLLRSEPDLWREMIPVLERRAEFLKKSTFKGEHHRDFAPLFAAINLDPRIRELAEETLDRTFAVQSAFYKEQLQAGNNYVPELVVGTGVHAAIYSSAKLTRHPENPCFCVDLNPRVGGQFAQAEGEGWLINSRERPEDVAERNLPGTKGSLNTLLFGTLQPADIALSAYGPQTDIAIPTRVDHLLSSRVALGLEVTRFRKSQDPDTRYIVEMADAVTGQRYLVRTDRVILSTGIGEPITGLDETDPMTVRLLQDPRVILGPEFHKKAANKKERFALKDYRRMIVVGPGDNGKTVIERLLGYGPRTGKSSATLDWVENVTWIGQEALTKEEFEEQERQRYRNLGLEFPREGLDYYSRIIPIRARATRLEEAGDNIRVIYKYEDPITGEVKEAAVEGDHVVLSPGNRDRTDELVKELYTQTIDDKTKIADYVANDRFEVGTVFRFKSGNIRACEVIEVRTVNGIKRGKLNYYVSNGGSFTVDVFLELKGLAGANQIETPGQALATEFVYDPEENLSQPIASKYVGQEIYKVGPAAKIPLSKEERSQSPALQKIPQNAVAIFRSAKQTARLAIINGQADAEGIQKPGLNIQRPKLEIIELPPAQQSEETFSTISLQVNKQFGDEGFAVNFSRADALRLAVGERLYSYQFPPTISSLTLNIARYGDALEKPDYGFLVSLDRELPSTPEYHGVMQGLLADPIVQKVITELTDQRVTSSQQAQIRIPFNNGRVDVENVSWFLPHLKRSKP